MKTAQFIAAAVTAALLGTAGVSIAGAVASPSSPSPTPVAATTASATATAATAGRRARGLLRQGVRVAAQAIGITPQELAQQLRAGQSIADVATAHHVDPQRVVDALVAAATKRIDAAHAAGKLTDAQASKLEANLNTRITKVVNRKGIAPARRAVRRAGLAVAAQAIGITTQELAQQLRAGRSIADVATAHGVAVQTVENALLKAADAKLSSRIDKLVHRHFTGMKSATP
jgi:uncharacterized protein (DUF433 family)